MRSMFESYGSVDRVNIVTDRDTGQARGFGFVEMATEEGAQEAIKRFNGYTMDRRNLTVNEARPRENRPAGGGYGGDRGDRGGSRGGGYGGGDRGDRGGYGGGDRGSRGGSRDRF